MKVSGSVTRPCLKKNCEITSSELIFGGFQPFRTTVGLCFVQRRLQQGRATEPLTFIPRELLDLHTIRFDNYSKVAHLISFELKFDITPFESVKRWLDKIHS